MNNEKKNVRKGERPRGGQSPKNSRKQESPSKRKVSSRPDTVQQDSLFPVNTPVRLNKFIANAGICSRRHADKLIESGAIKVNGEVVTTLGTKINPGDRVEYAGQKLQGEQLRYVLLNKPKGFITTVFDPQNRKTVMQLVEKACKEHIRPVGRLDNNTTGLLLFTNDGDLAKKLTHPKHRVRKVYHAELDKPLTKNDMIAIAAGLELDDGLVMPDVIVYAGDGSDKKKIGIEIHSGKNRIVRRIFEKLGYDICKLDRVLFANLTKKDLPRGKWRFLTQMEVNILRRVQ
jgi:23S rRNA pseudouridine2605 synthase